jgi:hypothetical protein
MMKKIAGIVLSVVLLLGVSACSSIDTPSQDLTALALPGDSWAIYHNYGTPGVGKSHRAVVNAKTRTTNNALYGSEYQANSYNSTISIIPATLAAPVPVISVNSYFSVDLGLLHIPDKVKVIVSPGIFACTWQKTPIFQIMNCSPYSTTSLPTSLSSNTLYTITVFELGFEAKWKETTKAYFRTQ